MTLRWIGGDWGVCVDAFALIVAAVAARLTELPPATALKLVERRDLFKPESIAIDLRVYRTVFMSTDTENNSVLG